MTCSGLHILVCPPWLKSGDNVCGRNYQPLLLSSSFLERKHLLMQPQDVEQGLLLSGTRTEQMPHSHEG